MVVNYSSSNSILVCNSTSDSTSMVIWFVFGPQWWFDRIRDMAIGRIWTIFIDSHVFSDISGSLIYAISAGFMDIGMSRIVWFLDILPITPVLSISIHFWMIFVYWSFLRDTVYYEGVEWVELLTVRSMRTWWLLWRGNIKFSKNSKYTTKDLSFLN